MVVSVLQAIRPKVGSFSFTQMYKYVTVTPGNKRRKAEEDAVMENLQNSAAAANADRRPKPKSLSEVARWLAGDSGASGGASPLADTKDTELSVADTDNVDIKGNVDIKDNAEKMESQEETVPDDKPQVFLQRLEELVPDDKPQVQRQEETVPDDKPQAVLQHLKCQGFAFEEKEGDLFSCPTSWSLAHCISVDAHMGKGIAVLFKNKFKGVEEIRKQGAKIGGCAVLKRDDRFIYYLTTKERYFEKPTYDNLRSSLETMKKHCGENDVKNVAMPMIGCGLDRLEWPNVKDMIQEVFGDIPLAVTVYKLGKGAAQPSKKKPHSSYPNRPRTGSRRF